MFFKKMIVGALALIPFLLIPLISQEFSVKNVEFLSSYQEFNYSDLVQNASIIALIEVEDDLTNNNSIFQYTDEGFMSASYSRRNVQVLKYYKDEFNLGNQLTIIEPAAISDQNEYIHSEDYEALEKGKRYLVFLSDETESGELSILSANNGRFDISNFEENEFHEIFEKFIIEIAYNWLDNTQRTTIKNFENATLESVNYSEEYFVATKTNILEDLKNKDIFKITFNTTEDDLLGPIVVYIDKDNLNILGVDFRD